MPSQVHRRRPAISATLDPRLYQEARELGKVMGWTMSEVLDEGLRLFLHKHTRRERHGNITITYVSGQRPDPHPLPQTSTQ